MGRHQVHVHWYDGGANALRHRLPPAVVPKEVRWEEGVGVMGEGRVDEWVKG